MCIYIKLNHRLRIGSWWFNFLPCQHLIENAGNEYEGLHCNTIYISSMAVQRMCVLHIRLYKHYIKWYNFLPCQNLIENAGNDFFLFIVEPSLAAALCGCSKTQSILQSCLTEREELIS